MTNEKWLIVGRKITKRIPILIPILRPIKTKLFPPPQPKILFSGWGMTTVHQLPWINDKYFQQTSESIKSFEFDKGLNIDSTNVDILLWRHWIVSSAVRHAIEFAKTDEHNFVDCGVSAGLSAFFALREIQRYKDIKKFSMHLYDSWSSMKKEHLLESESLSVGNYGLLSLETTKNNLSAFNEFLVYHPGYIPESLSMSLQSPDSIVYLHVDLNSAKPTENTLEFFYPRLISGGVILFDDYGWVGYDDTRITVNNFFNNKPGIIFPLPTGQAIYYKP